MKTSADFKLSENEMRYGSIYEYTTPDGSRTATLDYSERGDFRIYFNGTFLHLSKTFKSFEKRFIELANKWELEDDQA